MVSNSQRSFSEINYTVGFTLQSSFFQWFYNHSWDTCCEKYPAKWWEQIIKKLRFLPWKISQSSRLHRLSAEKYSQCYSSVLLHIQIAYKANFQTVPNKSEALSRDFTLIISHNNIKNELMYAENMLFPLCIFTKRESRTKLHLRKIRDIKSHI